MSKIKLEQTIKRSRAAQMLDKTPRTLVRYEQLGILTPIKLNCRSVVYTVKQVHALLTGQVSTDPKRIQQPEVVA